MPLECERSSTSPSATGTAALTSAALIASEVQHNQQSASSTANSATHLNEELTQLPAAGTAASIMDGEMSTSQTSTTSNSSSCNGGGSSGGRKTSITSPDPTAYVAKARVTRPTPPPPPYNPMQFVQIKPCNLYQTAQEQLKKAEEVKKIKEVRKEEPEDWQNNLDNWKSSRRKRVEHIIDRVVEVKKLELEEHDRTRRKSKTFSEMIENRSDRVGRPALKKLASLAVYTEDESNDLSDLGIGTSSASGKSSLSEDYDNNSVMSDNAAELDKAISNSNTNHNNKVNNSHHSQQHQHPHSQLHHHSNDDNNSTTREYISSPGYETSSSTAPASTPDPCEYTYEGAIQDYKQRVSRVAVTASTTVSSSVTTKLQGNSKESTPERTSTSAYPPRRGSKIEDRLIGFEVQSPSEECVVGEKSKVDLPKIDISKRKEIFEAQAAAKEKQSGNTTTTSTGVPRVTLRDRFKPSVESENIETAPAKKEVRRLSGDITSIKERLQSLEQQKQQNLVNGANGTAAGPGAGNQQKSPANKLVDVPVPPLKERLSSLQNAVTKEEVVVARKPPVALVDARQLEIMKSEEEKAKQQQQQQQQVSQQKTEVIPEVQEVKDLEEVKSNEVITTTTTIASSSTTIINNNKNDSSSSPSEVDRDDSGIHTADDIDLPDDHLKKEQELKLNAAIEALAMEEKQFAEAANAVNQIEAEFEELSLGGSVTLPPLANANNLANTTTGTSSSTTTTNATTSITNDHMEYSINEALELALAAIDKESSHHQPHHPTNEEYFPQPQTVPSSNNANNNNTTAIGSNNNNNTLLMVQDPQLILTNKTDEEKQFLSGEAVEIQQKSEEEISKEPIYENVNMQQDLQQQQQQQTIIPSMNPQQQQSELNQNNEEKSQQNCSQINQSQTTTTAPILAANNNSNNNNNNNNHDNNNIVVELTNAFANTTLLTTTTMNTTTAAQNSAVESETLTKTTNNSNNNNTTMFSENLTIEQTKANMNSSSNNNNMNTNTTITDVPDSTLNQLIEPNEPYYQVPKSCEPYYDAPKHLKPIPVYENIEIFFNGNGLAGDESSTHLEPPKEKPPPPPIESPPLFDDVDSSHTTDTYSSSENTYETLTRHQLNHHLQYQQQQQQQSQPLHPDHPSPPMKRMNSTKRIKKELRNKRSSFLGIEGSSMDDDDSYLELTVAPPPDMAQLLQEERRLEKQMYLKAGLCDSSDTGESRDSGVSENHSRQSSEHYTNSSEENEPHDDDATSPLTLQTPITLDPPTNDMIYQNDGLLTVAPTPLLQTVKGNSAESWTESATVAAAATQSLTEATATANAKMLSIEEKIREQEEVLRVERELLQLEQEELKRQRENLMLRENMARRELQHGAKMLMSANRRSLQDLNGLGAMTVPSGGGNLNIEHNGYQMNGYPGHFNQTQAQSQQTIPSSSTHQQIYANIPNLQQQYYQMDTDYRKSMSDINEFSKRMMQPPPVPPSKPMRAMHINTNNNSATNGMVHNGGGVLAVDATDYVARQRHSLNSQQFGGSLVKIAPTAAPRGGAPHIYSNYQQQQQQHHHHQSEQNLNTAVNGQQLPQATVNQSLYPGNMSRNTLHALSATPKPKYTDGWVQVQQRKSYDSNLTNDPAWMSAYQQKRKSMPDAYHGHSNNHWLVQEAEQRRLVEQQQQRRVQSSSNTPTHTSNPANKLTNGTATSNGKPLPDSIIQTLTERVQSKGIGERKRNNLDKSPLHAASQYHQYNSSGSSNQKGTQIPQSSNTSSCTTSTNTTHNNLITTASTTHRHTTMTSSSSNGQLNQMTNSQNQDKVLSVSGKKKCSHCGDELGRGAAMIIESLLLFYHINCFKCCVCHVQLGDGLNGTDVRVRNHKLHCQNCYSSDDGIKFSCV